MLSFNKKCLRILFILWIISLCLPGIKDSGDSTSAILWIYILAIWWMGIFNWIWSWYSIIFSLMAMSYLTNKNESIGNYKAATFLSGIWLILLLQAFMFEWIDISYIDSNGSFGTLSIGYYLYLIILISLFALSLYNFYLASNNPTINNDLYEN